MYICIISLSKSKMKIAAAAAAQPYNHNHNHINRSVFSFYVGGGSEKRFVVGERERGREGEEGKDFA